MKSIKPTDRPQKVGWYESHYKCSERLKNSNCSLLLIGDSIINGLSRYNRVWNSFFSPLKTVNCGVGGDKTQHVPWRAREMYIPPTVKYIVVQVGTNNLNSDTSRDISEGIMSIASILQEKSPLAQIIITGLLPRDLNWSDRRRKIDEINVQLKLLIQGRKNIYFMEQDSDWTTLNNQLNMKYYYKDFLHLIESGNKKLALSITHFLSIIKPVTLKPLTVSSSYLSPSSLSPNIIKSKATVQKSLIQ